ncbi:hypothetical protein PP7435_CHR1-2522 [Komagataella phaffii CBS 7435]|uniref:DUF4536 domain-containing protein n=1 Tax=Komagataella phaffii (strain ATCC 76273 / CBS 7435 / CECT 11047 / NRRL Y-11430 / Wegner 21-1) TaxID=981350 RepID=A0A1G4KPB3_KOMPC|nr:hypothetical protein BQ9382_C1-4100 [Komagataella phaffii CBS 7435]SCV11855.1 hypothetical protein PP7435_CHR1-2522 [Komagataella phaffii CBS 7435]
MSNILKVISPDFPKKKLEDEHINNCLPCQLLATATSLVAGSYLATGYAFAGEVSGRTPMLWKRSVRMGGCLLIFYGIYRGTQGWLLKEDDK